MEFFLVLSFQFLFSEQLFSGCFLCSCQFSASIARPAGVDWCLKESAVFFLQPVGAFSNPPIASRVPRFLHSSMPVSDLPGEDSSPQTEFFSQRSL